MISRGGTVCSASSTSSRMRRFSPPRMSRLSRSSTGRSSARAPAPAPAGAVAEQGHGDLQGVVALAPAVEDQVLRRLPLVRGDLGHRDDLGGVEDGQVQPGLDAVVEHQRVQHVPDLGRQAEADVAHPEDGEHAGEALLDLADGLQGLHGRAAEAPRRRCPG